jgi:DNA polymerase IV
MCHIYPQKAVFHIDVNNAYLSWSAVELLKNGAKTDLRKIPSIIGGDPKKRHGVVLAKSTPAKQYGIQTGETVSSAKKKCSMLRVVQPDRILYQHSSNKLIEVLSCFSSEITRFSIDECFMEYKNKEFDSILEAAHYIRQTIYHELGFTVNIGISTNRLLAKMASDFQKPDRVHTLFEWEMEQKMWPLPINELFMVGRASREKLKQKGFFTIGDIARSSPVLLERILKKHGVTLNNYANGKETAHFLSHDTVKGISHSTTLPFDTNDFEYIRKVLMELSEKIARRLKQKELYFGLVSIEVKTEDFKKRSIQKRLQIPTNDTALIYQTALELFEQLNIKKNIRHLGIRIGNLEHPYQQVCFCNEI